jgi:hypothetical protein
MMEERFFSTLQDTKLASVRWTVDRRKTLEGNVGSRSPVMIFQAVEFTRCR